MKEEVIKEPEIDVSEENIDLEQPKEEQNEKFKTLSRTVRYNVPVQITNVSVELTRWYAKIIIETKQFGKISHKIKAFETSNTFNHIIGMPVQEILSLKITKENLNENIPQIFKSIAELLKQKGKPVNAQIVFHEMTALYNGEEQTFRYMSNPQVNLIYVKEIASTHGNIERQLEMEKKNKEKYNTQYDLTN